MTRAAPIELCAPPQEFCSTKGRSLDKTMNLHGDACCLEMDLTVDWSAPPRARGAAPAYYLDRSSVGGCACL